MLKFVGRYFYLVVTIFSKNRVILVKKLWGEKKLSKSVFGYFKTKKERKYFKLKAVQSVQLLNDGQMSD